MRSILNQYGDSLKSISRFFLAAMAFPASAVWQNSKVLLINLPPQRSLQAEWQYYLADGTTKQWTPLSVLNHQGQQVALSTSELLPNLDEMIQHPLRVVVTDQDKRIKYETFIQNAGLLDELYFYSGKDLGLSFPRGLPTFKLWAPTAESIDLLIFSRSTDNQASVEIKMIRDKGVWSAQGDSTWLDKFYLYRVRVFSPETAKIETYLVTDPYSVSLSINSRKSQIINIDSRYLKPTGWNLLSKPNLRSFSDISIMEVHLRDITSRDPGILPDETGTFVSLKKGRSFQWLKELATSGLTHIHFLPLADFATVNEDRSAWMQPKTTPSDDQLEMIKDKDGYNWGYDPSHYMVPEGSYSLKPDGPARIHELRQMIQDLNGIGLRVVVDVVFNHTYSSETFNQIVPLYFYRYDQYGNLQKSSCCSDLASEHRMVEKLMIDSLIFWAKTFKVDGFRFDLMNLHTLQNMQNVRQAIRSLSMSKDGVDGKQIYLYGEAWPFGSLEESRPGQAFWQTRSFGKGYGTFNDRLRDAARGGTTSPHEKSDQGFATGLFYDFNQEPANRNTPLDPLQQRDKVLHLADVIKVGLAGNLAHYLVRDHFNNTIPAQDLYFRGAPTGYASHPTETINYVSSHDGYTLWDAVQAKLPLASATPEDRIRTHRLMLALVALSQGIPFFEGGSDLLRSKSGDVDSYNSGDWFNQIDFTFFSNNWGQGLPPSWRNINDWSFWKPRLAQPNLRVQTRDITSTHEYFKALLRVRKSSSLFRMTNLEEINKFVHFPVDARLGVDIPGLIIMGLSDELLVFFNATQFDQLLVLPQARNQNFVLHPELNEKVDPILIQAQFHSSTGQFNIPPRSTVIFVTKIETKP